MQSLLSQQRSKPVRHFAVLSSDGNILGAIVPGRAPKRVQGPYGDQSSPTLRFHRKHFMMRSSGSDFAEKNKMNPTTQTTIRFRQGSWSFRPPHHLQEEGKGVHRHYLGKYVNHSHVLCEWRSGMHKCLACQIGPRGPCRDLSVLVEPFRAAWGLQGPSRFLWAL